MRYVLHLNFEGNTNNIAEYEALLHRLCTAITLGVRRLVASGDSELVVGQVMKASACHDHKMEAYYAEVRKLEAMFNGLKLRHIPRRDNEEADCLARIGSTQDMPPGGMLLDELTRASARWVVETQLPPSQACLSSPGPQALTQTGHRNSSTIYDTASSLLIGMKPIEYIGELNPML
jgi:ribonuclease HI